MRIKCYWEVPDRCKNRQSQHNEKKPGMKLINTIHEAKGDALIIAEDLGLITEDVIKLAKESIFSVMRKVMMASYVRVVILPVQDLLWYSSDTHLYTLGKANDNCTYRLTKEQLDYISSEYFRHLNKIYSRI